MAADGLTVAWPNSAAFYKRQAEDPAKRELITRCIRTITGAVGRTLDSGRSYVGQVVELAHRLPKLWARVLAGRVPVWKALRIADTTRTLPADAAAFVDRQLAPIAHGVSWAQIDRLGTNLLTAAPGEDFFGQDAELLGSGDRAEHRGRLEVLLGPEAQRPGDQHLKPLPLRFGQELVARSRPLIVRLLARHLHVAAERDDADAVLGVAALHLQDLWPEAQRESNHAHAIPAREQEVAELVDEHEHAEHEQKC